MEALVTVQESMVQMQSVFDSGLFQRFVNYIDREPTTVKGYITCLRRFAEWLRKNQIQQPQRADILAYKEYLNSESFGRSGKDALKPSTKQQYLRAVKQFFKWTAAEGLYPNVADNVHSVKVRRDIHRKDALEREAVKEIADNIDRRTETGKRLYAMYLLCVSCGLRTIEISRANVEDIKTVGGRTYLYVQGKGHTEHDQPVLLVPEVKEAVQDYMNSRSDHFSKRSPLFVSTSNRSFGQRIAPTTISTMLKKALVNAGYDSDRLTAHSLRHTSGTGVYKATGNIYLAQKHQRHSDVSTTEIYVHAEERETRNTEQQVFDYYFRPAAAQNTRQETINMIAALNPERLLQVCEIIKAFC
ncbi:MAG: site-specific integrase [Oscillospiraceae bacterium]|nr:site-specific integrase [Oscillospiraceae bacterium]